MNKEILDKFLFEINPDEQRSDLESYYDKLDRKKINQSYVYIFDSIIPPHKKMHVTKHARFSEVPTHIHTFVEINYVYSGSCTQTIDGKKIVLSPGELVIIDTQTPHSISEAGHDDIIINILLSKEYFTNTFFDQIKDNSLISNFLLRSISYTQEHDQYIIFHSENNIHVKQIIQQLLWESFFPSVCSSSLINHYLVVLFIELVRIFQYDSYHLSNSNNSNLKITRIISYIEENFLTCTLESVAKSFNYTPNYMSLLIKKATGNTYSEIILEIKLNRAKFLLENTSDPIMIIAEKSGFKNMTFFYKKYKKQFQVTPRQNRGSVNNFV